jgi:hypothetical protein
VRVWRCILRTFRFWGCASYYILLWSIVVFAFLYQQYDYFRLLLFWFVDGKFIVLCVSTLLCYSLEYIHFPLWTLICSFVWFWDSSWYLVLLVADGTIMYDAYSHQPCDQWYCAFYQDQLVLPVSNSYQWAVKGMGCESVTLTLARALLVRLWV